jgi:hypothetical protein
LETSYKFFSTQGNGVADNTKIGATIFQIQIVLNNLNSPNQLDVDSHTYFNKVYTNLK